MHKERTPAFLEKMVAQFRIITTTESLRLHIHAASASYITKRKAAGIHAIYANQFGSLSRHVDPKLRLEGGSFRKIGQ